MRSPHTDSDSEPGGVDVAFRGTDEAAMSASSTGDDGACSDWQEEKRQWMDAAGVRTPADLTRKIAEMDKVAELHEVTVKKLACNLMEVKTFLMRLSDLDEHVARSRKKKRRRDLSQGCTLTSRTGSKRSCGDHGGGTDGDFAMADGGGAHGQYMAISSSNESQASQEELARDRVQEWKEAVHGRELQQQ